MTRFYQNVTVPGMELHYEDAARAHSRFWNEGKWETFIEPLLPEQRNVFLEIGCNAGLFLKLACDAGFRDVYGVEKSKQALAQARLYQESNGYPYRVLEGKVSLHYCVEDLPLSDVVLMSNVHYHLSFEILANLVDRLRYKTRYCIVVAAGARKQSGRPSYDLARLRGFFADWEEMRVIENVPRGDDPAWRENMYGVLFRGGLVLKDIDAQIAEWTRGRGLEDGSLPVCLLDFFGRIRDGEDFRDEDTALYRYWLERDPARAAKQLRSNRAMAESVIANGMRQPVFFAKTGKFLDGMHRFYLAKALGHKSVLARIV